MKDSIDYASILLLRGFKIVECAWLTRHVAWRTERPWCHRKRHKLAQAFKYHSKTVPDNRIIRTVDSLVMHPDIAKRLRAALASAL